jgi:hypothetical protein
MAPSARAVIASHRQLACPAHQRGYALQLRAGDNWHSGQAHHPTDGLCSSHRRVYIHPPEGLILYKLMCFGLNQQSKHSRDMAAILKSKKDELDLDYIEQWTFRLGLSSLWKEIFRV